MAESHLKYGTNVANTPGSIGIDTTDHAIKYMTDLGVRKTIATTADLDAVSGVSGAIITEDANSTVVATGADTNETTLWTHTVPGGTLDVDGRMLRVSFLVSTGGNANAKTLKFYVGSSSTTLNPTTGSPNGNFITGLLYVVRTGASAQSILKMFVQVGTTAQGFGTQVNPTEDTTQDIIIKITGTNGTASAGDINIRLAVAELI